jgi:hypothetical protein
VRRATSAPEVGSPEKASLGGENEPAQPLGIWKRLEDSLRRESELLADVERHKKELVSLSSRMELTLEQSDAHAKAAKESVSRCQDMETTCAMLVRELIRLKVQSNRLNDIILQCPISRTGNVGLTVESERQPQSSSEKQIRVARLFEGGAAWKSKKIKPGDVLLAVDGICTSTMTKDDVQNMFAGPVGTPIILKLKASVQDTEYLVVLERSSLEGETIASEEIFEKSCRAVRSLRESIEANRPITESQVSFVDRSANIPSNTLPGPASEVLRLQTDIVALESSLGAAERDKAALARQLSNALEKISAITLMYRPSEVMPPSPQAESQSVLYEKSEVENSRNEIYMVHSTVSESNQRSTVSHDTSADANALARKLECAELAWFNAEEELTRARAVFDIASEEAKARLEEAQRKNAGSISSRVTARLAAREGEQKKTLGTEIQLRRELNAARESIATAERDKAALARQLSHALEKMATSSTKHSEDSKVMLASLQHQGSGYLHDSQLGQSLDSLNVASEAEHLKTIAASKGVDMAGLEQVLTEIKCEYAAKMSIARKELAGREETYSSRLMQPKKVVLDLFDEYITPCTYF